MIFWSASVENKVRRNLSGSFYLFEAFNFIISGQRENPFKGIKTFVIVRPIGAH